MMGISFKRSLGTVASIHPFRTLFLAAFAIRFCLAVVVTIRYEGALFSDDRLYLELIKAFVNSQSGEWSDYHQQLWSRSLSFLLPGLIGFRAAGSNVIGTLTVSAVVGSLIPTLMARLLSRYVPLKTAIAVGIVLALMPSQILWSSLLLKDGYIATGFILIALALPWWTSSTRILRVSAGALVLTVLLLYVQRIRVHSLVVVCVAVVISLIVVRGRLWSVRAFVAVLLLMILPWGVGGGFAGVNFARGIANGLEEQRLAGAIGADTAVVSSDSSPTTTSRSSTASDNQQGNVGDSLPVIDELRYLPSGLKVMLLDPTVTQLSRSPSLYLAFIEHLIWYPALLLALYGAIRRRMWTIDLVFSGLLFLGLSSMWGLAEGNFGTAFRHRTEFVWIVFFFAGLGLQRTIERRNELKVLKTQEATVIER